MLPVSYFAHTYVRRDRDFLLEFTLNFGPINATSAVVGVVGNPARFGIGEVQFNGTPAASGAVPEPATWAMMLIGFGAIGAAMRGRDSLLNTLSRAKRRALDEASVVKRQADGKAPLVITDDRIVAVGLLTRRDVDLLGPTFNRGWPVEDAPCFSGLLQAIDQADRDIRAGQTGSTKA